MPLQMWDQKVFFCESQCPDIVVMTFYYQILLTVKWQKKSVK